MSTAAIQREIEVVLKGHLTRVEQVRALDLMGLDTAETAELLGVGHGRVYNLRRAAKQEEATPTYHGPRSPGAGHSKRVRDTSPGPWMSTTWRKISRHGRAIKFIQKYCRSPKGVGHGQPLVLATFQKEFLEEALADGIDSAAMPTPRGNGKSTFGAGIATWAGFDDNETGAPQVPIVATTVGQAIRSVFKTVVSMVAHEPELANRSISFTSSNAAHISIPYNEGEIFPIANDPDGLQGLDFNVAICDEIGFQPPESWAALIMAGGKRSHSLAIGLGTPGVDRNNALSQIRSLIFEGAIIPRFYFREYAADPDRCIRCGSRKDLTVDHPTRWVLCRPCHGRLEAERRAKTRPTD